MLFYKHHKDALNQPKYGRPIKVFPVHNWKQTRAYGEASFRSWSSWTVLTGLAVLIAIVIGFGILVFGTQVIPNYEPEQQTPSQMWQDYYQDGERP